MTSRTLKLTVLIGLATLAAVPGYLHAQVTPEEHAQHHPEAKPPAAQAKPAPGRGMMEANNAKLDELVTKMNAAQGQAKVDAIAEVVTALVQQHQAMHGDMSAMMSKMGAGAGGKK